MLPLIGPKTFETRGHCLKIQKRYCRTKLRANFFGFLTVNMWNGLSDDVVLSPTLNSFKGRIDRHWRSLRYSVFWWCHCLLMIWFNGSDLISPKANNGLLQPRLQDDNDDVVFVLFCPMFQFITFEIVQGRSRSVFLVHPRHPLAIAGFLVCFGISIILQLTQWAIVSCCSGLLQYCQRGLSPDWKGLNRSER